MPEITFFFGPPFSGKTLYYLSVLSITHEWISPEELFHADPTLSLRLVILKVVNFLKKGKNVAVDSETLSTKTRASYISLIKAKVPDCTIKCLIFQVHSEQARLRCSWAYEWDLGRQFGLEEELIRCQGGASLDAKLDLWFSQLGTDLPSRDEGFNSINEVAARLICDSPYEMDLPGLFIQWDGILEKADQGVMCRTGVTDVITKWSENNPSGSIIIVSDGMHTCKESGIRSRAYAATDACSCLEDMKRVITLIASKLPVPLFFVRIQNPSLSGQFAQPPSPGLLAWLQRLHNINLTHRATFYIHFTETHYKAATAAGIKGLTAKKVFGNATMISAVYCGKVPQSPDCVRNACVASFGGATHTDITASPKMDISPSRPLFHKAMESRDSDGVEAGSFCVLITNVGRVYGVCCRDKATLQRYRLLFQSSATPSKPASPTMFESKPIWSPAQRHSSNPKRDASNTPSTSARSGAISRGLQLGRESPHPVVSLQEEHVAKLAYSPGHLHRGMDCKKALQDFTTTDEADGIRVKCNCKGSFGRLYTVSALLGQSGVTTACCSCPDPAGKLGKCKHVVAMLTTFIDKDTRLKGREASKPCRKEASVTLESYNSGKRTRQKKAADKTIYCMSPDELMETAQEVLNEYLLKTSAISETEKAKKQVETKVEQEDCEKQIEQNGRTDSTSLRKRGLVDSFLKDLIEDDIPSSSKVLCKPSQPENYSDDVGGTGVSDTCQSTSKSKVTIVPESLVPETVSVNLETAEVTNSVSSVQERLRFAQPPRVPTSAPQASSFASACLGMSHKDAILVSSSSRKTAKERPSVLDEFI